MRERRVSINGVLFLLVARGPEEELDRALDAVEAVIEGADFVLSGSLDVRGCFVRFERIAPRLCLYGA